jgi:hypothetical protein
MLPLFYRYLFKMNVVKQGLPWNENQVNPVRAAQASCDFGSTKFMYYESLYFPDNCH